MIANYFYLNAANVGFWIVNTGQRVFFVFLVGTGIIAVLSKRALKQVLDDPR